MILIVIEYQKENGNLIKKLVCTQILASVGYSDGFIIQILELTFYILIEMIEFFFNNFDKQYSKTVFGSVVCYATK